VTAGTIPAAFLDQARRTPDRVAVMDDAGRVSYAELDERSDRVAASLLRRGFRRAGIGVLLADRSLQMIAGLLGVLKAGGAYLPLDVTHPRRRIERVLAASAPSAVLASGASVRGGLGRTIGGHLVMDLDESERQPAHSPAEPTSPDDLAYVIYTSGSTGEPKGTLNEHRAVVELVHSLRQTILDVHGPALRIALVASLAFDASIQQIFSALLLGHTLCIVPEGARRDPWRLVDFYRRHQVDVTDGTPTHLAMLCQVPDDPEGPLPIRQYIIGGETLTPEVVSRFRARWCAAGARITNVYGVAECAVDSSSYLVDDAAVERLGFVPIGRPLPHAELSIRDRALARVRPGVRGEMCIGGAGVGRGYLGDRAQTAERFVTDPGRPGRRLYRTGDIARELPDGTVQHCGRLDRQVALRGHRVELGEIEAALLRYRHRGTAPEGAAPAPRVVRCERCLLDSTYPRLSIEQGVCSVCRWFERARGVLDAYFGTPDDLRELVERARARSSRAADCLLLFSGGKDSTYALYRLMEMGLRVQTFTFDNGFISETAFDNIRRITSELGVEHVTGGVTNMPAIFAESLRSDSTVCSGCFRGLTAVSTSLAQERWIGTVLTGLSRGQIAETKLRPLLEAGIADVSEIERRLVTHRKLYHARGDRTAQLLNVALRIDAIDEIEFIDYFRYDPATTREIRAYLRERSAFWREPKDTGLCSTNCRINEVGIYVHRLQRGFHNYTAPLSWDCRLGVLARDDGLRELGEAVDEESVRGILGQIGYEPAVATPVIRDAAVLVHRQGDGEPRLTAYYAADRPVSPEALRAWLLRELPEHMVPAQCVQLDAMPVTVSGKTDYEALAAIAPGRGASAPAARSARTATERRLLGLWAEALDLAEGDVGPEDDFFALGGSSLTATVLVGLVAQEFGVRLSVVEAFADPTPRGVAGVIEGRLRGGASRETDGGAAVRLAGNPATMPGLFLCPDVSGAPQSYVELAERLATACATWRVGVGAEPDLPAPIEALGAAIAGVVGRLRVRPPWVLAGWSFGGVLALEAAARLEHRGDRVGLLVVIDADVPDPGRWSGARRQALAALAGLLGDPEADLGAAWRRVRALVEGERRVELADVLRRLPPDLLDAGVAAAVSSPAAQLDLVGRVLNRADALAGYAGAGPVPCPILYVAARDSGRDRSQSEGWRRLTTGAFSHAVVPGDHLSLVREPQVADLAATIVRHLPAGGRAI
jgi:amino acid adenylation domain-containing protein